MITDYVLITTLLQSMLACNSGLNWCTFVCNYSGLEVHNGLKVDYLSSCNEWMALGLLQFDQGQSLGTEPLKTRHMQFGRKKTHYRSSAKGDNFQHTVLCPVMLFLSDCSGVFFLPIPLVQILEITKTSHQTLWTKISASTVPVGEFFCGVVHCSKCRGSFPFCGKVLPQAPRAAQKRTNTSNIWSQHQVIHKRAGNLPTSLEGRWSCCFLLGTVVSWRAQSQVCSALIRASKIWKLFPCTAQQSEQRATSIWWRFMRSVFKYTGRFDINPQNEII